MPRKADQPGQTRPRVLVVDDEDSVRILCREALEREGYEVFDADDGLKAEALMESRVFDLVLADILMPGLGGLDLLQHVMTRHPDTVVIMFTGHGSVDLAKEAMRRGAFDFIQKPFHLEKLREAMRKALDSRMRSMSELPGRELSILHSLTLNSTLSSSSEEFMHTVALSARQSFGADVVIAAMLAARDSGDPELVRVGLSGAQHALEEEVWTALAHRSLSSPSGLLLADLSEDPLLSGRGSGTVMAHQIPSASGALGVIIVARSTGPDPFTPRDLKLLSLIAAQAGSHTENSRMADELRRQTEELEHICSLSGQLSATLSVDRVLRAMGTGLRHRFQFDALSVVIAGEEGGSSGRIYQRRDLTLEQEANLQGMIEGELGDITAPDRVSLLREPFDPDSDPACSPAVRSSFSLRLEEFSRLRGVISLASFTKDSIDPGTQRFLSTLTRQAATAISNAHMYETSEKNYFETIAAFARAVDAKDPYTHDHSRNVTAYVLAIADYIGLSDLERSHIRTAALLHDIGKIGVPEAILNKPGALTDEEYEIIKRHPEIGHQILSRVAAFREIVPAVLHHHERFDGRGYPARLAGEAIPFYARLLAVADAFDAIVSDRVYRPSTIIEYAMEELRSNAGRQFDPEIAYAMMDILTSRRPADIRKDYSTEVLEDDR
ncbi:response regulator [Candidatus Fermentibacterales bacterium]|nr:response regulator [Candidatus Fermentibacterales bacterium]